MNPKEFLLPRINGPEDLKAIPRKELPRLTQEIRQVVLDTVSAHGGHLASSLGAVELTVALHYVFDPFRDRIVWDVGHQTYAHKLLTGRREAFATLRQFGGLSGFPRRSESRCDAFDVGHSSTSISAALGLLEGRNLQGSAPQYKVVAVIGDGSMTAGLAFEGLNQAGDLGRDLIVILNDNEMSISRNVGALRAYLSRLLTRQSHFKVRARQEVKELLKSLPPVGEPLLTWMKKMREAVKVLITPGVLFEEMGFKYIGPIDGHNLEDLIDTLERVRGLERPVLVHVMTQKGKGYLPAERDPASYHGVGPFDLRTGQAKPGNGKGVPSYTQVFSRTMVKLGAENPRVVGITAAMPSGTGLEEFGKHYPERFYDVGIAEQHGVTFAAGLAVAGLRPVVAIYSTFLQRAYDQILHDVCLTNLPVTFALDRAGLVGEDGPTHHGAFDLSYLRSMPRLVLMSPKDENELQHMLKTAIEHPGPAAVRYPRGQGTGVSLEEGLRILEIGRGELLREGEDGVLVAIGHMVQPALEAADALWKEGIEVAVINARFIKPLDGELIREWALRTGKVVTIEENVLQGGFGSAVLELLSEEGLGHIPLQRIGLPDQFIEHGSQAILRKKYGLDAA
ncbi:MAG: 1-deoxy-D-xylulose-5-phosphate synthase [Candidatus Tectomicrobia bacterium]|uniref:1-deoxy-D-xylulose-5-phosphate synthase n=1 Tax=Tectimicrobiota bacterium TaxID=2528274 RepID=A0A932FZG7_UNCTE|nr:1-deoxy-D-xylulose-5-phosphate synthase [Candidatus Tectomicrobia bacterium]